MVARGPGVHTFRVGGGKSSYSLVAGGSVQLESAAILKGLGEEKGVRGARVAARAQRHISRSLGRTLRRKMRAAGKRAAAGDWGDAASWSFSFDTDGTGSGTAARDKPAQSEFDDADVDMDLDVDVEVDVDVDVDAKSEYDGEPVTEEERITVLRMLSEGKITAAEAEQLLDALGSQD